MVSPSRFDAFYYAHCCGVPYERSEHWLRFFGNVAGRIEMDMRPRRVLDAGCAHGFLVEALRERAIAAFGVDVSTYAVHQVHESVRPYCREASIAEPFGERYDLITCIEVVEHMPAQEAERAIANLCAHADEVLFSSSPFDYREPTHVNVHPPEHWAELFARYGFIRDVDYDASFLTAWAVRFRRSSEPLHRVVRDLERRAWLSQLAEQHARAQALEIQDRLARTEVELARANAQLSDRWSAGSMVRRLARRLLGRP